MIYKDFGNSKLSALGFGAMRLPGDGFDIDYNQSKKMLDYAIAKGINYFDTAYIYNGGRSEEFLGRALAEYDRDSFFLADKFNMCNPDCEQQFGQQLERLRTEHIDFYMLHGVQDSSADSYLNSGAIEYFAAQKESGKIKYLGISVHCSPGKFAELLDAHPWDFVQIQLNYYDWLYGDAKALYEIAVVKDIPIMVMEPVRGGVLANLTPEGTELLKACEPGRSIASWAFRWVANLPGVAVVLSGMSNFDQVQDNIATFESHSPLTAEQSDLVMEAAKLLRPTISVACTSCRYCCDDCPQGLDIPHLLTVYNDAKIGGDWRMSFLWHFSEDKLPSACIACGLCTDRCPQGFHIPKYMEEMARMLKV